MMFVRSFFPLLLCLTFSFSEAQSIIPRFETIGVNEGLSQSSVYTIHQDKAGFMWFGTADGLNRYDGNELELFKAEDHDLNAQRNFIRGQLCEDGKGNIWYANESGIYFFHRQTEKVKTAKQFPRNAFSGSSFEALFIDGNNILWLMNASVGIAAYSLTTREFRLYEHPVFKDERPRFFFKPTLDNQNIWFSFIANNGLYSFDTRTKQYRHWYAGKDCRRIQFSRHKRFLLGEGQISIYDSLTKEEKPFLFPEGQKKITGIHTLFEDEAGRLWALTESEGIVCYDRQWKKTYRFRHNNSQPGSLGFDVVRTYFIDRTNNLWIGTDGGGVSRLDLKLPRFNLFPHNEGAYPFLKDYFIKCFYEDEKRRIWFGTNSDGFSVFDPATGNVRSFSPEALKSTSFRGKTVGAITRDREGNMWIGHSMGFSIFDEKTERFTAVNVSDGPPLKPAGNYVHCIRALANGNMVAATSYGLVYFKKKAGKWTGKAFYNVNELGSTATYSDQTADGKIWVTCPSYGLLKIEATNDSLRITQRFFEGLDLRSFHIDGRDDSILWIASGKGLIRFDTRSFQYRVYNEKDGMANSYVYGILENEAHDFWISTNGGLLYFNREKALFQNFNFYDGLQSNEFNTGAFHKGASGTFYFGGIKGFNWFKNFSPGQNKDAYKPAVAITGILIDDRPFEKDSFFSEHRIINLPYNQNHLAFSFAALDFTRPQANKLQYKLEGWDLHWVTTQAKTVRYPNLPPGGYVFKIKATNADGAWSEEQQVAVFIKAPFWQRWWFYAVIGITILASAVIITKSIAQRKLRQQVRELEKRRAIEAERNRISRDMHDEIGSGLTHIALMSELMQTQKKREDELKKDVGTISQSARKLVQSMSEIVWALNPQNDTLENLLAYVREQAREYFEPFDIDFSVSFPLEVPSIELSNEKRRNLFLVAKEALNNVLKHAGASRVDFAVHIRDGAVHFYVQDNGIGHQQTTAGVTSNGLRNMQKRMTEIGGKFQFYTNNKGTTVHFCLPLSVTKPPADKRFFAGLKK